MHYLEPKFLIELFGTIGVISIVFAESGLFFGFFLPGDSLLFTAGLFASQGYFGITALVLGCMVAAIAGDSVGYIFGHRVGKAIFTKEDSRFFNKKHIERAQIFYEKYGVKTIVIARFIPIVRTFAPIVAGVGQMKYRTFVSYNIIGGISWVALMLGAGYVLGRSVPGIQSYLHYIVLIIIMVSFVPVALEFIKSRRGTKNQ
jgi:membrane-associated protein